MRESTLANRNLVCLIQPAAKRQEVAPGVSPGVPSPKDPEPAERATEDVTNCRKIAFLTLSLSLLFTRIANRRPDPGLLSNNEMLSPS